MTGVIDVNRIQKMVLSAGPNMHRNLSYKQTALNETLKNVMNYSKRLFLVSKFLLQTLMILVIYNAECSTMLAVLIRIIIDALFTDVHDIVQVDFLSEQLYSIIVSCMSVLLFALTISIKILGVEDALPSNLQRDVTDNVCNHYFHLWVNVAKFVTNRQNSLYCVFSGEVIEITQFCTYMLHPVSQPSMVTSKFRCL